MKNINKAITFAKKETVLIVAMLLAVISAFFVTPDKAYAKLYRLPNTWTSVLSYDSDRGLQRSWHF